MSESTTIDQSTDTLVESTPTGSDISLNLQATATGIALIEMEGDKVFHAINMGREISLAIAQTIFKFWEDRDNEAPSTEPCDTEQSDT